MLASASRALERIQLIRRVVRTRLETKWMKDGVVPLYSRALY